ncbi:Rv3235 family protein [Streptomyces bohaiensis]|uniref:Rv3235 family protein n=1 Tax=Streptomyces bohaiensis TaxID=1431344 RepID=UPI003BA2BE3D
MPDPARPHDWFAERLVQVLSGRSPVHTLLGHVRPGAFDQLVRLAEGAPLREGPTTAAVRRVGFCRPAAGVLEVFARIGSADRVRALAFRLEHRRGRWWCSAVELGPGPRRRARVPTGG